MDREIYNYDTSLHQEDTALVKAFLAGEKGAFDNLVLRHKDRVFNLCYRFLGEYEEANDCAQETFVKVYMSLKKFRFDANFTTWLYRITVNTCKNKILSKEYRYSKKTVRLGNPGNSGSDASSIDIKDESLSPRADLEREEKNRLIQEAIDSLPEEQKSVVVLRDIEGVSYEEISNITGQNLGTVKSKLSRAREKLREKLKGLI